jgi:hydroxymethylpyrimidine pyrophosphatase-like HAD family hydrolase
MENKEQTKIRLFASDLDGTLLNEDHLTDSASLDMITKVFKCGRYFSTATGRSFPAGAETAWPAEQLQSMHEWCHGH